jgi:hypothetical protein
MKKNDPLKKVKLKKIKLKSLSLSRHKDEDYLTTFYHNPFPKSPRTSISPTTYADITTTSPLLSPEKCIDNLNSLFGQKLTNDLLNKLNLTPIKDKTSPPKQLNKKGLTKKQIFDNQRKLRPKFKHEHKCSHINCKKYFYFGLFCHHCRGCGNTVCLSHGLKRKKLLSLGYIDKQRVCDSCYYSSIDNNPNVDRTPPMDRYSTNNYNSSPSMSISNNLSDIINDIISYTPKPINITSKNNSIKTKLNDTYNNDNNTINNSIPICNFSPIESEEIKINVIDGSSITCSPITPVSSINTKNKKQIKSPMEYSRDSFIQLLDSIKGTLHENDDNNINKISSNISSNISINDKKAVKYNNFIYL